MAFYNDVKSLKGKTMPPPEPSEEEKLLAILKDIRDTLREIALEQIRYHEWRDAEAEPEKP